ncbi:hypothetical protein NE237_025884 [Protea cynaroides]|uniref:Uncharacterized protein n=1 Tax=Protea cynaroides TaxID=273540 RepID=A0A9Q0K265_9MAGN|nr:hypothetical protein NE237_025884 [Protea cynaroides]
MADYQFEYNDCLVTECGCLVLEEWRKLRYDATCRNRQVRLETYRGVWEDQILVSKEGGDSVVKTDPASHLEPSDENGHHNPSQLCMKELKVVNKKTNKEPGKDFQVLMSWRFFVQVTTSHGLNITKMSNGKIMDIKKLWWSAKMSSGEITIVKRLWWISQVLVQVNGGCFVLLGYLVEVIESLRVTPFGMVDLGCSCGGNTVSVIDWSGAQYLPMFSMYFAAPLSSWGESIVVSGSSMSSATSTAEASAF